MSNPGEALASAVCLPSHVKTHCVSRMRASTRATRHLAGSTTGNPNGAKRDRDNAVATAESVVALRIRRSILSVSRSCSWFRCWRICLVSLRLTSPVWYVAVDVLSLNARAALGSGEPSSLLACSSSSDPPSVPTREIQPSRRAARASKPRERAPARRRERREPRGLEWPGAPVWAPLLSSSVAGEIATRRTGAFDGAIDVVSSR